MGKSHFRSLSTGYCLHYKTMTNEPCKQALNQSMDSVPPLITLEPGTAGFSSADQAQPVMPAPRKSKSEMLALSRDTQVLSMNWLVLGFMLLFHLGAIAAFFFFSWTA